MLLELHLRLRDFLSQGGPVLWLIFGTATVLWTLILERFLFFVARFPQLTQASIIRWRAISKTSEWRARQVRRKLIAEVSARAQGGLPLIRMLIVLCPLFGILGAVSGMIEVFDFMASAPGNQARAMADGIARATLPTMAGLVVALSGLIFSARLQSIADAKITHFADALTEGT